MAAACTDSQPSACVFGITATSHLAYKGVLVFGGEDDVRPVEPTEEADVLDDIITSHRREVVVFRAEVGIEASARIEVVAEMVEREHQAAVLITGQEAV